MGSILDSIKSMLGIDTEDTSFDSELIILINSVLNVCKQLGVGPTNIPFAISSGDELWIDFIPENQIEMVKTYIFAKVKIAFDPPSNSFTLAALQDLAKEFEWRCNVEAETP